MHTVEIGGDTAPGVLGAGLQHSGSLPVLPPQSVAVSVSVHVFKISRAAGLLSRVFGPLCGVSGGPSRLGVAGGRAF